MEVCSACWLCSFIPGGCPGPQNCTARVNHRSDVCVVFTRCMLFFTTSLLLWSWFFRSVSTGSNEESTLTELFMRTTYQFWAIRHWWQRCCMHVYIYIYIHIYIKKYVHICSPHSQPPPPQMIHPSILANCSSTVFCLSKVQKPSVFTPVSALPIY